MSTIQNSHGATAHSGGSHYGEDAGKDNGQDASQGLSWSGGDSVGTVALMVALVSPDDAHRQEAMALLMECQSGKVRAFNTYPTPVESAAKTLGRKFDAIFIELDSDPEYALDLVESLCAGSDATVMVCSSNAGQDMLMRCMRAGAREFLPLPLDRGLVTEALVRAAARRPGQGAARTSGKLMSFMGTKGGAGVTTVATNYAVAMAMASPEDRTLFLDLDLPMGDAALNLGIHSEFSTINALQSASRLDEALLSTLVAKHSSGLWVLAAPGRFMPYNPISEDIDKLLEVACRDFENVIVDVGSRLDMSETSLFRRSSTVYMITQVGIADLRNSSRLISHFFESGHSNVEIVINRYEPGTMGVNDDQIDKLLSRPARWKIPSDYNAVRKMQVSGSPLVLGDSHISKLIQRMARTALGETDFSEEIESKDAKSAKSRGFGGFRRVLGGGKKAASEEPVASSGSTGPLTGLGLAGSAASYHELQGEESSRHDEERHTEQPAPEPVAARKPAPEPEPAPAPVQQTRVYKGSTYIKGEDGQWHLLSSAPVAEPEPVPAPAPVRKSAAQHVEAHSTPTINWAAPQPLPYGTPLTSAQLNAKASVAGKFEYSPAAGEVLEIGRHTITATFHPADQRTYTTSESSVSVEVVKGAPIITWNQPEPLTLGTPLGEDQLNARTNVPGRFIYNPAAGTVLAEGEYALSVIFFPEDSAHYATAPAVVPISVVKAKPLIIWETPAPIVYGTPLGTDQLLAMAEVPGNFSYAPGNGEVLNAGAQTLTLTFTPEDTHNFAITQATVSLQVLQADPSVSWIPPDSMHYGETLSGEQLRATAAVAGSFVYSPAAGDVLEPGSQVLKATFKPKDAVNFATVEVTAPITVHRAEAVVQWFEPEPILYGTPLGGDQLKAAASMPGVFRYAPAEGEVLSAGLHMLSVEFLPEDSRRYAPAKVSVPLRVVQVTPTVTWKDPAPIPYGKMLDRSELNAMASVPGVFTYSVAPGDVLNSGTHTLTADFEPKDAVNYMPVRASVSLTVNQATPKLSWAAPSGITYGTALSGDQLNAKASCPGDYSYLPDFGAVLAAGTHYPVVTFTPHDKVNYRAVQAKTTLTVNKLTPQLSWSDPAPILAGTPLSPAQLNARASIPGRFVYSPGVGTALGPGRHRIEATFVPADAANYGAERVTATISVIEAKETPLQWAAPAPIPYGTPLSSVQLNASAGNIPGTFFYTPSEGTVLAPGEQKLTVTFIPQDESEYAVSQASVLLRVGDVSQDGAILMMGDAEMPPSRGTMSETKSNNGAPSRGIPGDKSEPEIRVYKGSTYVKGADGQWHLQTK